MKTSVLATNSLHAGVQCLKTVIAIVCMGLMSPAGWSQSDCPECRWERIAVQAVRAHSTVDSPLQAIPLPTLRDDLITLTTERSNPAEMEVPQFTFYKVTSSIYQQKDGKVVSETVELDRDSEWIVAIDSHNDKTYLLEGFAYPIADFNRLAEYLHLQVADTGDALGVFDLFLKLARGQQFRSQVVGDEMKLESVALEDFRLRFSPATRRAAFNSWWTSVSTATKNGLRPPAAGPTKNGFEVRYSFYLRGNLSSRSLTISRNGTVSEHNLSPSFQSP
jgi:hypothetical protein